MLSLPRYYYSRNKHLVMTSELNTNKIGRRGEDLAVNFLKEQGFTIKARNYRLGRVEVDIIASKEDLLVFVEVKVRSNNHYGTPEACVDNKQEFRYHEAANAYIAEEKWEGMVRFDTIAINLSNRNMELTHFEDAF